MNDQFDDLIASSLHARATGMPVVGRGVNDVRRRVRARRHRRMAATMLPVLAGLSYAGVRSVGDGSQRVVSPGPSLAPGTSSERVDSATAVSTVPDSTVAPALDGQNFLIAGSDANACVDPDSQWAGAADPAREDRGNRSDTIMVMRVDPVAGQASVLSFPRDLWVDLPGRGMGRINAAYVENDYSLLAQTIYDNFGITVDHYIQIDFCAFKRIVDSVGGVTVPFATRILDRHVGIDIPAGCHTFSGDEALAYVRARHLQWVDSEGGLHEDGTSDLGRISRQQDFLQRTMRAALDKGLFDPAVARGLIESLQTNIVTEAGFTIDDMLQFARTLEQIDPSAIGTYQVEASGMTVGGNSVLRPELTSERMQAVLSVFRGDDLSQAKDATAASGASGAVPASPSTVASDRKGDILPDVGTSCE